MTNLTNVRKFLERVEEVIPTYSDPQIMRQIVEAFGFNNLKTTNEEFKFFIHKIQKTPIDLSLLINKVKIDVLSKAPLCELLDYIETNNLITNNEILAAASTLQVQIHALCLLEAITVTMDNSNDFGNNVYQHIIKNRGPGYTGNPYWNFFFGTPFSTELFGRIKKISVEPGMTSIIFHRLMGASPEIEADLDEFVAQFQLSGWNADIELARFETQTTSTIAAMGVNILEASVTDCIGTSSDSGGKLNAEAGFGLIEIMEQNRYSTSFKMLNTILPEGTSLENNLSYSLIPDLKVDNSPKKVSQFHIPWQWRDLYNCWNLRFVIANLDPVLVPLKLLIPTVFSAEPANFKEVRVLTLFLLVNIVIDKDTRKNPIFANHFFFKNAKEMLLKWGEINKNYANKLLQELCSEPKETDELYHQALNERFPYLSLGSHLLKYIMDPHGFRVRAKPLQALGSHSFFSNPAPKTKTEDQINDNQYQP
ncbi:symporter [Legionella sainthelensi]|uniref:Symporter n=1 Tax=Legionella sainthelensi TaxID=28087 RepID=A0A2H5FQG7_9GAMM|nr:symporter [Legionella sainthelensi]AUH73805.1 symporter [Legionella sainthelensi]